MISEQLEKITHDIAKLCHSIAENKRYAKRFREDEAGSRKQAEEYEALALECELKVDQLQLELRKVLNGQISTIPVELPLTADDQVGRIG